MYTRTIVSAMLATALALAGTPPLNLGFAFSARLSAAENRANEGGTNQGSVNFQRLFHTTYWC